MKYINVNIVFRVEVVPSINEIHHCTASLKVNNSLTMSGEQKAMDVSPIDWNTHLPVLYLGGIPKHLHHFVDIPVKNGITGCMQGLQVLFHLFNNLTFLSNKFIQYLCINRGSVL